MNDSVATLVSDSVATLVSDGASLLQSTNEPILYFAARRYLPVFCDRRRTEGFYWRCAVEGGDGGTVEPEPIYKETVNYDQFEDTTTVSLMIYAPETGDLVTEAIFVSAFYPGKKKRGRPAKNEVYLSWVFPVSGEFENDHEVIIVAGKKRHRPDTVWGIMDWLAKDGFPQKAETVMARFSPKRLISLLGRDSFEYRLKIYEGQFSPAMRKRIRAFVRKLTR